MDIKVRLYIPCVIILMIFIGCNSSKLSQKNIDKNHVFSSYKLNNNPDKEAFHFKITVYEEDGTPSKRRVNFITKPRPVTRHKSKEGHYYSNIITYSGIIPSLSLWEGGYRKLDYMKEDTLKLYVRNSKVKIPSIPIKLGKSLEVTLYLNSTDDY